MTMTDIEYFLFGAAFGLAIKVFVAALDALAAMFDKDKRDAEQ
jgi:hypothetical protein